MKRVKYDDYIVFVLGTDNFELSKHIRENKNGYGMDEIYDFCIMVAEDFEIFDRDKYNYYSQYESLEIFLRENTKKYIEIFDVSNKEKLKVEDLEQYAKEAFEYFKTIWNMGE